MDQAYADTYAMSGTTTTQLTGMSKDVADSGFSALGTIAVIVIPLLIFAFGKKLITKFLHA